MQTLFSKVFVVLFFSAPLWLGILTLVLVNLKSNKARYLSNIPGTFFWQTLGWLAVFVFLQANKGSEVSMGFWQWLWSGWGLVYWLAVLLGAIGGTLEQKNKEQPECDTASSTMYAVLWGAVFGAGYLLFQAGWWVLLVVGDLIGALAR